MLIPDTKYFPPAYLKTYLDWVIKDNEDDTAEFLRGDGNEIIVDVN